MREHPKFGAICFDCDSTLTRIEGIDELAQRSGRQAETVPLTAAAMDGTLPLEEIYTRRLEIVRPGQEALAWLGARYIEEMVDGARETIAALQGLGKPVYVVTFFNRLPSWRRPSRNTPLLRACRRDLPR